MTLKSDIDTQIEEILEAVRIGGWYDANPNSREANYMDVDVAHKAIKTLLIQSKIDELEKLPRVTYTKDGVVSDVSMLLQHQHIKERKASLKRELT